MFRESVNYFVQAIKLALLLGILTGIVYPLVITAFGQIMFPQQANGNLIKSGDQIVGSALIGQEFSAAKYFWSRPSATQPFPYNPLQSGGSNLGPSNPVLLDRLATNVARLRAANPDQKSLPGIDMITASGSGLDPDISLKSAYYQVPRIAKARHLSDRKVIRLVRENLEQNSNALFGLSRINVLTLNIALDKLSAQGITHE